MGEIIVCGLGDTAMSRLSVAASAPRQQTDRIKRHSRRPNKQYHEERVLEYSLRHLELLPS